MGQIGLFEILGGKGSGNRGHSGGRGGPGNPGGSTLGKASSASMNAFGVGGSFPSSSQSKGWAKQFESEYENNEDFRSAVKVATAFAGGNFKEVIAVDRFISSGETPDFGDVSFHLVPKDKRPADMKSGKAIDLDKASISDIANPMSGYSGNPFESSPGASNESILKGKENVAAGVKELNRVLRDSAPLTVPIYRGIMVSDNTGTIKWEKKYLQEAIKGRAPKKDIEYRKRGLANYEKQQKAYDAIFKLKKGDSFYMKSFTSFSADKSVAMSFSIGTNPGQSGKGKGPGVSSVIFEIAPGAKGVSISRFSKWKQKEVITKGNFVVDSIEEKTSWRGTKDRVIRLKQK
jgi:hypothetical protein